MRKGNSNKALIKKLLGDTIDEAFVISAIESYCQTVLEDETNWDARTLINKELWQVIATRNLQTIEEHYK
jgi:hypothetical protein